MKEVFLFLIYCLFIYRLTSLVVVEDGPFGIFQKIRNFVGVDDLAETQTGYFAKLFSCVHCMSVMLALVFWPLYLEHMDALFTFAGFLAVSAVVILLKRE